MKPKIRLIILGHPRSGTGYAAKLAQAYGMDVGHEKLGSQGISSWMWAAKEKKVPWGDGYVPCPEGYVDFPIYIWRDPLTTIESVYFTEGPSLGWRAEQLGVPCWDLDGPDGAAKSILEWYDLAYQNWGDLPSVRLHDLPAFFETLCGNKGKPVGKVNSRPHPSLKNRMREIDEGLERIAKLYDACPDPRETALLWHYQVNPDHHTWATKENLGKAFSLAGIDPKGIAVLDAGCGKGAAARPLLELGVGSVDGFDYSPARVAEADKGWVYSILWVGNIYEPLHSDYDVILCLEVLEHLSEPNKALNNLRAHAPVIGSVPLNHPYKAHLNVYTSAKDVEDKLNVTTLWSDKDRVWFLA